MTHFRSRLDLWTNNLMRKNSWQSPEVNSWTWKPPKYFLIFQKFLKRKILPKLAKSNLYLGTSRTPSASRCRHWWSRIKPVLLWFSGMLIKLWKDHNEVITFMKPRSNYTCSTDASTAVNQPRTWVTFVGVLIGQSSERSGKVYSLRFFILKKRWYKWAIYRSKQRYRQQGIRKLLCYKAVRVLIRQTLVLPNCFLIRTFQKVQND